MSSPKVNLIWDVILYAIHTVAADLPGPLWATMAPETALIQLCISSGLSAWRKQKRKSTGRMKVWNIKSTRRGNQNDITWTNKKSDHLISSERAPVRTWMHYIVGMIKISIPGYKTSLMWWRLQTDYLSSWCHYNKVKNKLNVIYLIYNLVLSENVRAR